MYRTRTCIEEKKKANAGPNKIKVIYDDYSDESEDDEIPKNVLMSELRLTTKIMKEKNINEAYIYFWDDKFIIPEKQPMNIDDLRDQTEVIMLGNTEEEGFIILDF